MNCKKILLAVFLLVATLAGAAQELPQLGKAPIADIIAHLTLEEKASLLVGYSGDQGPAFIAGSAGRTAPVARLGIPLTVLNDGPTGLRMDTLIRKDGRKYFCTGFPVATLLAATWDKVLVREVGATIGRELQSYDTDVLLAPAMNIHRNPLNGRNFEYYSEDPVLSGWMAAAMTQGLQSMGVGATLKHYIANNQQSMRMFNDSRMTQRTLREIYLRNFEIALREGHPWAVMSSYNSLNGTRVQSSYKLLTEVLRQELGFDGIVMTDWGDPRVTVDQIHAGNDLLMGGKPSQVKDIIEGVKTGKLSLEDVDRNVSHVLRYILKTRSFKGLKGDWAPDLKAHAAVARRAAAEGMVLLKNEKNPLPLSPDDSVALFGVGSYLFYANGLGSADVNKPYVVNLMEGLRNAHVKLSDRLDRYYRMYIKAEEWQLEEANVKNWHNWFFGYKMPKEARVDPSFIRHRAKDCSKAIITIARNAGECLDRDYVKGDYLLTDTELALIKDVSRAFHEAGKTVTVILNTGGVVDTTPWKDEVDAILLAWQPGEEGGNAVADVLTGKVNPSGKLPMTWALNYEDYPSAKNFPLHYKFSWDELLRPGKQVMATPNLGFTRYEEGIYVGYRYFDTARKPVAYPFGYGLSYTSFIYSKPKVSLRKGRVDVKVKVTNTGQRAGKEVVELYVTAPKGKLDKPLHELKAFGKTRLLQPGETEELRMSIRVEDLASFDEAAGEWIVDRGVYTLSAAAAINDIRSTATFRLK